ncbi:MAG: DUF2062 domain-containing protein [Nitrospinae bacterium]|nr:DUF2062 domain-containing protein [Nitrospinota bacterium]
MKSASDSNFPTTTEALFKLNWRAKWHSLHDWYDHSRIKLKKWLPDAKKVEDSPIRRLFGATLLKRELWSFKREPVARGLALGLFVAVTPTMGFQWIVAALLVVVVPANLPIALAACLITNPLTTPAFLYAEYVIGSWMLEMAGYGPIKQFDTPLSITTLSQILSDVGMSIVIGSLILGAILGVGSYFFVHAFVAVERKLKHAKLIHRRMERSESRKKETGQP